LRCFDFGRAADGFAALAGLSLLAVLPDETKQALATDFAAP